MRISDIRWTVGSWCILFLLGLCLPAAAQQMTPQQNKQQMQQPQQNTQQMQQPQQNTQQMQQYPQQRQTMGQQPQVQQGVGQQQMQAGQQRTGQQQVARQGQSPQEMQLIAFGVEPITRVAVAYDFDDDGEIDAVNYVRPNLPPVFFLDQQQSRQGGSPGMAAMSRGSRSTLQGNFKVQGKVQDLRTARVAGSDEQRVFALVQTRTGKNVAVDLGPQWKVNQLNLKKGDQISALGRISQVDQKPVISAFNVKAGNQRITVPATQMQATSERGVDRYDVTLLNTRNVNIPNGPSVVLSKVRLQNGATTLVNLGPQNALGNLNLQPNQQVRILARPVQIQGRQALVAERIAAGNQQVDINWNQVRTGQQQTTGASPG